MGHMGTTTGVAIRAGIAVGGSGLAILVASVTRDSAVWLPDLAVALAFVALCAYAAPHSRGISAVAALGGIAWMAGTLLPTAHFWHRGVLIQLLVSVPWAWPRSRPGAAAVVAGYAVSLTTVAWGNDAVAAALAVALVAMVRAVGANSTRARRGVPLAATVLFAGAILAGSVWRAVTPESAGIVPGFWIYCIVVVAVLAMVGAAIPRHSMAITTDLIVELGEAEPGGVRQSLADAVGDSTVDQSILHAAESRAFALAQSNSRLNGEVSARMEAVRRSRRRILVATDEERNAVSAELKGRVIAPLAKLRADLPTLASDDPAVRLLTTRVQAMLDRAIDQIVEIAQGLHPRELDSGIAAALTASASRSPVPVRITATAERFAPEIEAAAYYACEEALTNALRHTSANEIRIDVGTAGTSLVITVSDDGNGGADASAGTGIRGITDRVESLGGTVELRSPRGAGTMIRVRLPALRSVKAHSLTATARIP